MAAKLTNYAIMQMPIIKIVINHSLKSRFSMWGRKSIIQDYENGLTALLYSLGCVVCVTTRTTYGALYVGQTCAKRHDADVNGSF